MSAWHKESSFSVGHVPVQVYRSEKTGMKAMFAQIEGPLCNAYIVLATECLTDDGLPHTLEHLCFLGSQEFPYKGVLDKVAFRNFATGTNAYTDVHHTAYTITTAGTEGMLALLPVFADHVFFPTLTDSGFVTEIYHIDGEGNDAGVVYCEMQAIENEGGSMAYLELRRLLYPGGKCGYASETGGLMADIRTLTLDRIKKYHTDYYRPDNACLIVTGMVNHGDVFESLAKIESKLPSMPAPPAPRTWFSNEVPAPTPGGGDVRVEFASDEEDTGTVMLGWRGGQWRDFDEVLSLCVLHSYLGESEVSALHVEFVEGGDDDEEGVCGSASLGLGEYGHVFQYCSFDAVKADGIDSTKGRLLALLAKVCDQGIDMKRMGSVIRRFHTRHLNSLEDSAHDTLPYYLIMSFLFGQGEHDCEDKLKSVFNAEKLLTHTSEYWTALIKRTLLDTPVACVRAFPSTKKGDELAAAEEGRLASRAESLGEQGLASLAAKLDQANEANNAPIPPSIVSSFDVPDVQNVPFIPIVTATYPSPLPSSPGFGEGTILRQKLDQGCDVGAADGPPFYIQFDHVPSDFCEIRVLLHTDGLPANLRPYLELYLEAAYSLPIVRAGGEMVGYEQVVNELQDLTITYSNSLGIGGGNFTCGPFSQVAIFHAKCIKSAYTQCVSLLGDVLFRRVFDGARLAHAARNLLSDATEQKREGEVMAASILKDRLYASEDSNIRACNIVRQQRFLTDVLARLSSSPGQVEDEMGQFVAAITSPDHVWMQVIGDMESMSSSAKRPFLDANFYTAPPQTAPPAQPTRPSTVSCANRLHSAAVNNPSGEATVLVMTAIESSFLSCACRGIPGFSHADTAPLLVACEILTAIEGPMWNEIRGLGLAYSFSLYGDSEEGLVYFSLSRSNSLSRAYSIAGKIVRSFASGDTPLEGALLENAVASVVSSVVSREQTISMCGLQSIMSALRGTGPGHNKRLLAAVQAVTKEDVERVIKLYLVNAFQPGASNLAITTNPTKAEEVVKGFEEAGWRVRKAENCEDVVA